MSFYPVNKHTLTDIAIRQLASIEASADRLIEGEQAKRVHAAFGALRNLFEEEQKFSRALLTKEIKVLSEAEKNLLGSLEGLGEGLEYIHAKLEVLFDTYQEMGKRIDRLAQSGYERNIGETWAQEYFIMSIEQGDPNAIRLFGELVKSEDYSDFIFSVLIYRHEEVPWLGEQFRSLSRTPEFADFIMRVLNDSDDLNEEVKSAFFRSIEGEGNQGWAWKLTLDAFEEGISYPFHLVILDFLLKEPQRSPELQEHILLLMEQGSDDAVTLLLDYFDKQTKPEALLALFDRFKERLKDGNLIIKHFVIILLSNSQESDEKVLMNHFGHWRLSLQKEAQRPVDLPERILHIEERAIALCEMCSKMDSLARVGCFYDYLVKKLILDREERLSAFFLSPNTFEPSGSVKMSTCFVKAKSVLFGDSVGERFREVLRTIVKLVHDALAHHGVEVCQAVHQSIERREEGVRYIDQFYRVIDEWCQDIMHPCQRGGALELHVPSLTAFKENKQLLERRIAAMKEKLPDGTIEPRFSGHGNPIAMNLLQDVFALSSSTSLLARGTRVDCTYLEGGNCLCGRYEDGTPFIIVGRDSFELNRPFLSKDMKDLKLHRDADGKYVQDFSKPPGDYELSEEEFVGLIALDLGIDPKHIHIIDQPFAYHLDTSMALVGDNRILLNDSQAAFERSLEIYSREVDESLIEEKKEHIVASRELAEQISRYEKLVREQLEAKGFEVIQIAGKFENPLAKRPKRERANFFNFISVTAPDGKNIVFALGGHPELEKDFTTEVVKLFKVPVDEVHLLDIKSSQLLQFFGGGIRCLSQVLEEKLP